MSARSPKDWMAEALILAEKAASEDEVPVGAILVSDDGRVLGTGYNRREQDQSAIAHAEIHALVAGSRSTGSWRLPGTRLFVTLEPCPMCLAACQQARVAEIFYGTADPKGGALSLGYLMHQDTRTNHRFKVTPLETPDCSRILKEFFAKKRAAKQVE